MSKTATKGKARTLGLKVDSIKKLNDADAANVKGGNGALRPTAIDPGGIRATIGTSGTSVILPTGNVAPVKP
jgi:hypothetical protein